MSHWNDLHMEWAHAESGLLVLGIAMTLLGSVWNETENTKEI